MSGVAEFRSHARHRATFDVFPEPEDNTRAMTRQLNPDTPDLSSLIRPGDAVAWGQADSEPVVLTRALAAQRAAFGRVRVFQGVALSDALQPSHADHIDFVSYCGSGANRALAKAGVLDVLPCHYSEFPGMIRSGALKIDVLMLQLAPPDEHGRYSLGLAHEFLLTAIDHARTIIAEVNDQCPWTFGERYLRENDLDAIVQTSRPPLESAAPRIGPVEDAIAGHVADLIEDGATLQFGLGAIPEAILSRLGKHRDLGVHSGTIGDGVAQLVESGVINNARKSIDPGVIVTGMVMGTRRAHRFVHRNPDVRFRGTDYVHNADVLARIERFTALNSAVEVDLTGQINAEVAGGTYVGAVGGALDFLRAARRSKGGLPLVALPSTAGNNSRIVARIASATVSTPRSDAGIIVTEHGVADLRGLSLRQRAKAMIAIAAPEFREELEREAAAL